MSEYKATGVSFYGLLTVLFVGLKLTGFISWSWWWVLSPLWISFIIGIIILVIVLYIFYGDMTLKDLREEIKESFK